MNEKPYPALESAPDFAALEEEVLAYWKQYDIFNRSVDNRAPLKPNGENNEYVFYDGPPFANGLPHHGHLLTGYVKDLFARYQTMKGKRVERRFGWDCHGLPAEMGAEKELKISGRQQIMKFGIDKFNDHCRNSVMQFADQWRYYVNRQGRWVDFDNDYKTMDTPFMESVIWAFSELYKKGLIYEGFKVMPYSWAAETVLSTSEIRLDDATREKEDKAITVAFKLKEVPDKISKPFPDTKITYVLAWTTTPWTLPSNLALAASKDLDYDFVYDKNTNETYIIPLSNSMDYKDFIEQERFKAAPEPAEKILSLKGKDLIGLGYEPLFPYFADTQNAFRILDGSDFVEAGSGTGIVHMAPGFGEDDQRVCAANDIETLVPVNGEGRYTDEIFDLSEPAPLSLKGLNVIKETNAKEADEPYTDVQLEKYGLANLRIIQWLKLTGRLIKQEDYKHNYPHCWRTDQPIIYRGVSSWFVDVPKFRDRMVEQNQNINWIPDHIKEGRFGKWLENAREWSISRSRFWGSPIPVWRSDNPDNKELYVFGSIAELNEFFDADVTDLHRPYIDELTKPDPHNPEYTIRRVEDVFDCWFESGSMPYAQVHYPFENKEWFETHFPAQFIVEYEAQTRGWFYSMMVLGVALFDKNPFENCICHGVVLDESGRKLSKKLQNYMDPRVLFEKFGSDALRWFMMSSTIMRGNELLLDAEGKFIHDAIRLYIKPIWNACHFFTLYANADGVKAKLISESDNVMDRYILAKLRDATEKAEAALDAYDTPTATQIITQFFEILNNWYIRRNRSRFWGQEKNADKQAAYDTLYTSLNVMCRVCAPLLPLISEAAFRALSGEESVHLADWPDVSAIVQEEELVADMDRVRDACTAIHAIRNQTNIRTRQPLSAATLYGSGSGRLADFASLIADETNIKQIHFSDELDAVANHKLTIHFPVAGKRLGAKMKAVGSAARNGEWELQGNQMIVGGETLQPEEYTMQLEAKEAAAAQALPSNDALVVLDTTLTPELEAEGTARDLVRMIQQARKDAGLDVSDRITLCVSATPEIEAAAGQFRDYICEQTQTDTLTFGSNEGEHSIAAMLNDTKVELSFSALKEAAA